MTPEQEYLESAILLQTNFTYKLVARLCEELFPNDVEKTTKLHKIVLEALEEIHQDTAKFIREKHKLLEASSLDK